MGIRNADELVTKAASEIGAILAELERQTQSIVREISLRAIDVTTYEDERTQHRMSVRIDMERTPGHQWS